MLTIILVLGAIIMYLGCKYLEAREEAKKAGYIYDGKRNDEER